MLVSEIKLFHAIASFSGVNELVLNSPNELIQILMDSASEAGLRPIDSCVHRFHPSGVTGVVIIAESHLSIHTWPELKLAILDILSCGSQQSVVDVVKNIQRRLSSSFMQIQSLLPIIVSDHAANHN